VEERIATLTSALAGAEAALHAAERECEVTLLAVEATARAEFERQLDAVRHDHTAELEAQARGAQLHLAEELTSALATAHAGWKQDTEKRLRKAEESGLRDLARAEANWRRRHKVTLWRAARLWRTRERGRLAEAKRQWQASHRQALDAGNQRWQARLDRMKRRARRSLWPTATAQRVRNRIAAFVGAQFALDPPESGEAAGADPAVAPLGVMAVALIVIAIHLTPAAPFPDAAPEPMATASAQAMPHEFVSALAPDRENKDRPAPGAATLAKPAQPMESAAAEPDVRDEAQAADAELRRRLQEKIRMLRKAQPAP
jgi:hypothetical protein